MTWINETILRTIDIDMTNQEEHRTVASLIEQLRSSDRTKRLSAAGQLAALEGELREPTEDELAEPWLELEEEGVSDDPEQIGVAGARIIRAVVTIEGMNREFGTVTVKDSRGKLHLIGDVEAEKMEGVKLGQTLVLVFAEALAMSLEKHEPATE